MLDGLMTMNRTDQQTLFFFRGPVEALHQRVPKTQVVRMDEWNGRDENQQCLSYFFILIDVH